MQKLFKIWLIVIIILAVIASFIVEIKSAFFGLFIIPTIVISGFILIIGFGATKQKKKNTNIIKDKNFKYLN